MTWLPRDFQIRSVLNSPESIVGFRRQYFLKYEDEIISVERFEQSGKFHLSFMPFIFGKLVLFSPLAQEMHAMFPLANIAV